MLRFVLLLSNMSLDGEQQLDQSGLIAVRLWTSCGWRIVVVDTCIPCDEHGMPVFCKSPASQVMKFILAIIDSSMVV